MILNKALGFYSGKTTRRAGGKQARGWPPERRMKQSARMRAAKIWRKTTGPKTAAGKAKSAQNATTHGRFNADWQALRKALTRYSRFLKWARAVLALARKNPGLNPLAPDRVAR